MIVIVILNLFSNFITFLILDNLSNKCYKMIEPVVLVHGGAGNIPTTRVQEKIDGVTKAAKIGYKILLSGGSVIDAVESAVNFMEDDIAFNAGKLIT